MLLLIRMKTGCAQHVCVRRGFWLISSLNRGDNSELSIKLLSRREEGELRPDGDPQASPTVLGVSHLNTLPETPSVFPFGVHLPRLPTWEHVSLPGS